MSAQSTPYSIDRNTLAQMVAAHISGIADAKPDWSDQVIAQKMIALVEQEICE